MPAKKSEEDPNTVYQRVKSLILTRVQKWSGFGPDLHKRTFRMQMQRADLSGTWFLLEDQETKQLMLIKGNVEGVDGCIDGFNVYARSSPLVSLMVGLGIINQTDQRHFYEEQRRISKELHDADEETRLRREAERLGFKLTPIKK